MNLRYLISGVAVFVFGYLQSSAQYKECAYEVNTVFSDLNPKRVRTPDNSTKACFYYYRGTLIELVFRIVTATTITENARFEKVSYDTIGVQLIDTASRRYVQFDSFYQRAKVIRSGLYKDSPIGKKMGNFKFGPNGEEYSDEDPAFSDTIIEEVSLKCLEIDYSTDKDSSVLNLYFRKDPTLFTPFMIEGFRIPGGKIVLSGFEEVSYTAKEKIYRLVENIRPLSDYERIVCQSLYSAAQSFLQNKLSE